MLEGSHLTNSLQYDLHLLRSVERVVLLLF